MALDTKKVYLLLGSNLGDRALLIEDAIRLIGQQIGKVCAQSSFYETAAWGREDQPGFLNVAIGIETGLSPLAVLKEALDIEEKLGRVRYEKWGSRHIDIDIVLFEDQVVNIPGRLHIPHPELQNRKFVLVPLLEIAPDTIHPVLKKSISEILESLQDNLSVSKI